MSISLQIHCTELCETEQLDEAFICDAVEHGVLNPLSGEQLVDWVFSSTEVAWFRRAMRLQRDLDLDWVALAMVVDLLRERDALLLQNQQLQQRIDRFVLDVNGGFEQ